MYALLNRYLWQILEGGKVKSLVIGLDKLTLIRGLQTPEELQEGKEHAKVSALVEYCRKSKGMHNVWAGNTKRYNTVE